MLALAPAAVALAVALPPVTPTADYQPRQVRGFAVLVHPAVLAHPAEAAAVFAELDSQLGKIVAVVPETPLAELRKVRIWVEWEAKPGGAAEFHVSAGWLRDHRRNPDKLLNVELNNARNFVKWSRKTQPWMVLHELAHAYHFRVLGDDHPGLGAAFKQANERRLYETVGHVAGGTRRAYALTSRAEYFAELSEAYFGKNDFFPYTRADLAKHDPAGYELMRQAWGEPRTP